MPKPSIRFTLTAPLLLLVLATGFAVAWLSFESGRHAVNTLSRKLHGEMSGRIAEQLNRILALPHDINDRNARALGNGTVDPTDAQALATRFLAQLEGHETVSSIYFGNTAGGLAAAGREGAGGSHYIITTDAFEAGAFTKYRIDEDGTAGEPLLTISDFDARTRPWYEAAVAADGRAWGDAYVLFTNDGMAMAPSRPVRDPQGNLLGVVATDIFLSDIAHVLAEVQAGRPGVSFVMEPSGLIVASSTGERPFVAAENGAPGRQLQATESAVPMVSESARLILEALSADQPQLFGSSEFTLQIDGERHFLNVAPLQESEGPPWLIAVVVPEAAYLGEVIAGNERSAVLIAGALVVAALSSLWLAHSIIGPIRQIRSAAHGIAVGSRSKRIDVRRQDELGELVRTFNDMASQLDASRAQQERQIAAAHEAEERLRQITENIREVLWMSDPEKQRMIYVSPAYQEIWGRTAESLYQEPQSFIDAIHPDDRGRVVAALSRQTTGQYDEVYRVVRPDGSIRWVRDRAFPVRDREGKVHRIAGIAEDISEQRRTEEQLAQSVRRFQAAAGHVSDVIYEWDPSDNSIEWYGDIDRLLGFGPDEFPWQLEAWEALLHADDRDRVYHAIDVSLETGEPMDVEYRMWTKDGRQRIWRDRGGPQDTCDDKGVRRWVGAVSDVTEQKEVEKARAESDRRLRTLVDNLPGGAYRILNDDIWTGEYRSAGYCRIWGYETDELAALEKGSDHSKFRVHPKDIGRLRTEINTAIADHRSYELEYRIITKDGEERWVWERGRCVSPPGKGPEILEGFVTDITEHHQLEERLRQAQKMEAVGQLTGGVAHDFNNLLAVILGNLELAEEGIEGSELKELVQTAIRAADRGSALTRQLLAFGRRQTLQPMETDLNDLLYRFEGLLRRTLGETIRVETRISGKLQPLMVDRGQLETALLNMALNARDAMPDGGNLAIEVSEVCLSEGFDVAEPDPVKPGRYVMIAVSDNGCGMVPDLANRAFEPFFTTKDVGQGTGLGLAMVYGFVKQSGGHVRIYSEPGQGTTVRLYLPRDGADEQIDAPTADLYRPARQGECVLLVEDDAEVRGLVSRQLQKLGYRVMEAADGDAAMSIVEGAEPIDLLLTDVVLPGKLLGPALAEQAAALRPNLVVAFMSGYPEGALSRNYTLPADVTLLSKPFRMDELEAQLRMALKRVGG